LYAVIPAYNVAETLPTVVAGLKDTIPEIEIIVVNDGSDDNTGQVIRELDIISIEHVDNRGKGAALKNGFRIALERGANILLTIDSDGQHQPAEARKLLDALYRYGLDFVIGNRMRNRKEMPLHRVLSNRLTSRLVSLRIGQTIEDSQCGYRAMRAELVRNIPLKTNHFDTESELLLKAASRGYKLGSVDVSTVYQSNLFSSIKVMDVFRFIKVYLRSLFW